MTQKLYTEMTAEEQLQWVTDFGELMSGGGERIVAQARSRQPQWTADDAQTVRRIVSLLAVWPFAQDFCEKAQRYGDYMARTSRLPIYIEKVKEKLADGLTMTDTNGRIVAYVNPSTPLRRRGRPTKEEVAARLRGETLTVEGGDDTEAKKRRMIAKMMGLDVMVSGDAPREKNNAEIAAEKAARKAEYEKQNPSLFPTDIQPSVVSKGASVTSAPGAAAEEVTTPPAGGAGQREGQPAEGGSLACPTMSEVYQSRIDQDRLRLSDLAWLCSDELRKRIPTVQALRVTAESASERAKTMADMGAAPKDIEPYAQQAKEAVEAYMAIYAAVDEELAVQFKRLGIDLPYQAKFKQRFKGVDIEKVLHICRPYYEKIKEQEKLRAEEMGKKGELTIDERIRLLIERDNPEYAARLKKEQEEKEEVQALVRYIVRKDKGPSDERIKTMTARIERLRELKGDEFADAYLPILEKTKEENAKLKKAEKKPTKKTTAKK